MTRPSLYVAVKHACLVSRLKGRLKSLIQDCLPSVELCRLPRPAKLETYAWKTVQG